MNDPIDSDEGTILATPDGHLLRMTVSRPRKLNGFTPKMMRELGEAYTRLEHDPDLRVGVLVADGPNFTAGLDLPKFAHILQQGEPLVPEDLIDPFDLRPPRRTKPVVVGTRGISFTLGVELSLAADVAITASDVRMSQIEVKRAIMATGGATIRMVERAGWASAMRWLLTGDEFDATEALRMNIVTQVVAPEAVEDVACDIARRIACAAPEAVIATRRNALIAHETGRDAAIAEFEEVNARLSSMTDAAEGVAAFMEKREPRFTGR
ncbi:MAG: crotonase/enoyl-CoA hydratase family protein [Pseudomonadota bacterium]